MMINTFISIVTSINTFVMKLNVSAYFVYFMIISIMTPAYISFYCSQQKQHLCEGEVEQQ